MFEAGHEIYELTEKLFPICRSITGEGVRETLSILSDYIGGEGPSKLRIIAVPTGRKVFDWNVPKEWSLRSYYVLKAKVAMNI